MNAEWQRFLAGSYDAVAYVQEAQGDPTGPLANVQASLAIRQRLANSDPSNAEWQHNLAISYHRLASIYLTTRQMAEAKQALQAGHDIVARLVAAHPGVPVYKELLAWFEGKLAAQK
jgi:hypothetical protein